MSTLSGGRIGIAAQALGIASGAYELSLEYSKQRKAFGKAISEHQAIAFKLAIWQQKLRLQVVMSQVNLAKDNKMNFDKESAMAKVFASEVAMKLLQRLFKYMVVMVLLKNIVERLMRDAKITQIYEGTSEIQRIVISRSILK